MYSRIVESPVPSGVMKISATAVRGSGSVMAWSRRSIGYESYDSYESDGRPNRTFRTNRTATSRKVRPPPALQEDEHPLATAAARLLGADGERRGVEPVGHGHAVRQDFHAGRARDGRVQDEEPVRVRRARPERHGRAARQVVDLDARARHDRAGRVV